MSDPGVPNLAEPAPDDGSWHCVDRNPHEAHIVTSDDGAYACRGVPAAQQPLSRDEHRALSERVNWDLIQRLAAKPHKHLNIVEGERYGLMVDGVFDTANNGVGEVMQEARAVQHLCDMAGVPEGWADSAHIDARAFLLISDLLAARERLARIASWHSLETGPGGMVGLYCIECGNAHPCETRRMADGTHEDLAGLPTDVVDPAARDARVRAAALHDFAASMRTLAEQAPEGEPAGWPWSAYALAAVKAEEHAGKGFPSDAADRTPDVGTPEHPTPEEAAADALRKVDARLAALPYRTVGGLPEVEREYLFGAVNDTAKELFGDRWVAVMRARSVPSLPEETPDA